MKPYRTIVTISFAILLSAAITNAATILVEAESFSNTGGWVVDQQFTDQMGSPILLAHGMGIPVKDASTKVMLLEKGTYHVWARTRNWVKDFDGKDAPGRFQLIVNGKTLDTTFGSKGYDWHWQYGGSVKIDRTNANLKLRDLTGFDGRCDAIVLSTDKNIVLPNEGKPMDDFRKHMLNIGEPKNAGDFDLVVIGGGIAGSSAAVTAARLGMKVALIQNRPVLGGNNSSEVRVHVGGERNQKNYPNLGHVVNEIASTPRGNAQPAANYQDEKKIAVVTAEKNIELFLSTHVFKVEMDEQKITAVIGKNITSSEQIRFKAPLFVDCTGDGTIGHLAGAHWRMGREGIDETGELSAPEKGDKMTMGTSVQWYSVESKEETSFPDCPWAMQFNELSCQKVKMGEWDWETGMNRDQITEFEYIRDHGLRVVYGNWAYLKNKSTIKNQFEKRKLGWVAYIGGKRESRRLMGDVVLQEQDITSQKIFDDAFVTATWSIDLHYPQKENSKHFPGQEFRSIAVHGKKKPYPIPYRCMYSRNVNNLFMAGRNISVTHVALGTVRVMGTTGMMGELVGMAASVCQQHDCTPRAVYFNHLGELKELAAVGVGKN